MTIETLNLTGNEKQIAWAKQILEDSYNTIQINKQKDIANIEASQKEGHESEWSTISKKAWEQCEDEFINMLNKMGSSFPAAKIIEKREYINSTSTVRRYNDILIQLHK